MHPRAWHDGIGAQRGPATRTIRRYQAMRWTNRSGTARHLTIEPLHELKQAASLAGRLWRDPSRIGPPSTLHQPARQYEFSAFASAVNVPIVEPRKDAGSANSSTHGD